MLKLFKNDFVSQLKKKLGEKELTNDTEWENVYQLCRNATEADIKQIDALFSTWFEIGATLQTKADENALLFYQWTALLQSRKYIPRYHKYQVNYLQLNHVPVQYQSEFKTLISQLIALPDRQIVQHFGFLSDGGWADCMADVFNIYNKATSDYTLLPERAQALQHLVIPVVHRFPTISDHGIKEVIEHHPEMVAISAEIIAFLIAEHPKARLLEGILFQMIRPFSKTNALHKHSAAIITQSIALLPNVSDAMATTFIAKTLGCLGVDISNQQAQIEQLQTVIARLKDTPNPNPSAIKSRQDDLAALHNNFETLQAKKWQRAYKKVAVSPKVKKLLTLLQKKLPTIASSKHISQLLNDAEAFKKAPKTYPLNQKPDVVFKDFGFKLWAIEALMYQQAFVQPKFDLNVFASEYTKREINREDDGYAVIPEVQRYFKNLNLPKEHLATITHINIDFLSGVYQNLWPFCDPGCGDELLPVSNKMIEDLDLLPNLKEITGLEWLKPPKKLLKVLEDKQITLKPWES